jgi:SH3 domain-containing YSC84-like protein 1
MKIATLLLAGLVPVALVAQSKDVVNRLNAARAIFEEVMSAPDRSIPQDLLDKAHCAVVVPGLKKGAFIFGGKYGKGFLSCRAKSGEGWTAPGAVRIEGGSVGFQIGGSETDIVMLVMNERGAERLLSSRFTLGADASVAAGPVGRKAAAQTDAYLTAQILTWSRSRGVFAGVSLQGATLRMDLGDNRSLYGKTMTNREIVDSEPPIPGAAQGFIDILVKYSGRSPARTS